MRRVWLRETTLHKCLYVKNFGEGFDSDKLLSTFDNFGKIVGTVVMVDETGKSRGFGFFSFETHDAAVKAVEALNASSSKAAPFTVVELRRKRSDRRNQCVSVKVKS